MPACFCLLNHSLTQNQIDELETQFNCTKIVYPLQELQQSWAQIVPEKDNFSIIENVISWLTQNNAKENDLFIIQGEYGTTFTLVDYALKNNIIPLYATTRRIAKEKRNGEIVEKQYIFEHVCFKKYKYF